MARILVVDDEPDVRIALTMLLEEEDHSVIQLDDGRDVLEFVREQGVDLILLDLSMPDLDGFQVLNDLRRDPRARSIPVIVVSARGRPDDKALAKSLGALDYVNKPWSEGEVEFRVNMALNSIERRWAERNRRALSEKEGDESQRRQAHGAASLSARRIAPPDLRNGSGPPVQPHRGPGRRVVRRTRRRAA